MKKFLFCLLLVVSFVALSGCVSGKEVKQIVFNLEDAVLVLSPNYEDRTLEVSYTYTDEEGVNEAEGILGGEFFDRFEEVVKTIELMPMTQNVAAYAIISYTDRSSESKVTETKSFDKNDRGIEVVEPFQKDIIDLLTYNSPV